MTPDPLNRLVAQLAKLPGIGEKTAQRLAFHILRAPSEYAVELAQSIREMKEKLAASTALLAFPRDTDSLSVPHPGWDGDLDRPSTTERDPALDASGRLLERELELPLDVPPSPRSREAPSGPGAAARLATTAVSSVRLRTGSRPSDSPATR